MFKADAGHYPQGTNALNDLVTYSPQERKNWHQYMDAIPLDLWEHAYLYECPGQHNPNSYDLSSMGPDGKPGTGDDICQLENKANNPSRAAPSFRHGDS